MLDLAFIRGNLEAVRENCRNRNVRADLDRLMALDEERRRLAQQTQKLQQQQNDLARQIPKEKDSERKQALVQEGRLLREKVGELEATQRQTDLDLRVVLLTIPNMAHPDAPVGTTAEDNKVINRWGEPRRFDLRPRTTSPWPSRSISWISRGAPQSPARNSTS